MSTDEPPRAGARGAAAVFEDGKSSPDRSKSNEGFSSREESAGTSMGGAFGAEGARSKSRPDDEGDACWEWISAVLEVEGEDESRSRSKLGAGALDGEPWALELLSRSKSRLGLGA